QITTPVSTSSIATGGVNTVTISTRPAGGNNLSQITDGTSNTISLTETAPAAPAILTVFPQRALAAVAANPSPVTGGNPIAVTLTFIREAASRTPTPTSA